MEITKYVVLKDNENSADKSLLPGALPGISRDMVVSKTDERITPKELEMGEQSRN